MVETKTCFDPLCDANQWPNVGSNMGEDIIRDPDDACILVVNLNETAGDPDFDEFVVDNRYVLVGSLYCLLVYCYQRVDLVRVTGEGQRNAQGFAKLLEEVDRGVHPRKVRVDVLARGD